MLLLTLNVIYVLLAIAMIAMILMQRGAGAQAGAGFGGGASATVFGSRGASNFLSKSTKWLAIVFMGISMFMAWHATHSAAPGPAQQDLGVMGQVPVAPQKAPAGSTTVPATPVQQAPEPASSTVPSAPVPEQQAPTGTIPAAPAQAAPQQPQAPPSGG
jgi:preprotein translocase subunit SecG